MYLINLRSIIINQTHKTPPLMMNLTQIHKLAIMTTEKKRKKSIK